MVFGKKIPHQIVFENQIIKMCFSIFGRIDYLVTIVTMTSKWHPNLKTIETTGVSLVWENRQQSNLNVPGPTTKKATSARHWLSLSLTLLKSWYRGHFANKEAGRAVLASDLKQFCFFTILNYHLDVFNAIIQLTGKSEITHKYFIRKYN